MKSIWMNDAFASDLEKHLCSNPFDLVVVDCMLVGVLARSKSFGVPTVVLVHSLFALVLKVRDGMLTMGNKLRVDAGLEPFDLSEAKWENKDMVLVTTLREFDDALELDAANLFYVGPVFEKRPAPEGWTLPWCENDARPLVLVSFSTNADQSSVMLLQEALDSAADLDARILVTTGGAVLPEALRTPANAKVFGFLPHELVLPHVSLMITHGGHGSVMAALRHGIPLVCKPSMGADQAIIAKRVQELGAGRAVTGVNEIAKAAEAVLQDRSFRSAARRFQEMIARGDGAKAAAKEIESFLAVRERGASLSA
jgi:MGT family glycosyltransferase